MNALRRFAWIAASATCVLLAGCAGGPRTRAPERRPADVRAELVRRMPPATKDREGWAADIAAAFAALDITPDTPNLCAVLAIVGQESGFTPDPAVPGLGRIARSEIDRRAEQHHVPRLVVGAALSLASSDGRSYSERIAAVRTERELSLVYEDLIDRVPLGRHLFADANPVRTGGPMQVSVEFALQHVREHDYPYLSGTSIRHEVFTRRGGVYFGTAHLLGYPASYERMLYRFADYNAGFYASRNAAFQSAVSLAAGVPLALDGDLVGYGDDKAGATERAVRSMAGKLDLDDAQIHRALEQGGSPEFEKTELYSRVFARAQKIAHRRLPRAILPVIALESPKITRKLTTEWFATRVDQRFRDCLTRAATK